MIQDVLLVIKGCLDGEERAWNLFVKEFGSVALNILRKFSTLTPQDHENVTQNVFVKLFKGGLRNFQGANKYEFLKYFKTIVINEGISYLKSEGRGEEVLSLNGGGPEGLSLGALLPNQNSHSRPDLTAEEKETLDLIKRAMGDFPFMDQQIFLMKVQGYKDEEIKKILRVPLGSVASKYSRMRNKIMEKLRTA